MAEAKLLKNPTTPCSQRYLQPARKAAGCALGDVNAYGAIGAKLALAPTVLLRKGNVRNSAATRQRSAPLRSSCRRNDKPAIRVGAVIVRGAKGRSESASAGGPITDKVLAV
jgi:hypothetical protein